MSVARRAGWRRAWGRARAVLAVLALLALAALPARAQVAVGDSLWRLGRLDEATAAYRRALEEDRLSVRANFRVAQTLAWKSDIDSALVLLRAARVRVPDDPDLLFTEATWLSWARRWEAALIRFDSLLTRHPGNDFNYVRAARARTLSWAGRLDEAERGYAEVLARDAADRDARIGLAQVRSWRGDLDGAAARYEALLRDDPAELRALIGLAQVRLWQQRPGAARALARRARAVDSASTDVRELEKALRAAAAPRLDVSHDWSEDSDRNTNRWQRVGLRAVTRGGLGVGASVATLHATDPFRSSRRAMAEGTLVAPLWRGALTGVLGARALSPAPLAPGGPAAEDRSVLSGRVTLQQRLTPTLGVTATVARWPFDEIASITPLALDIAQGDLALDWRPTARLALAATAGRLDWSDGNRKQTWSARATRRLPRGFTVGAYGMGFAFERRAPRYFSPPRFASGEVTGGWAHEGPRWSLGLGGGYGAQRVDTLAVQDQWHLDARAARAWGDGWSLELRGGRSTSAAASAVGAYAYSTLGLSLRRTF